MKKTTLVILATAALSFAAGCATTQDAARSPEGSLQARAPEQGKPVTRPFSGVGTYGGYTYRRYD